MRNRFAFLVAFVGGALLGLSLVGLGMTVVTGQSLVLIGATAACVALGCALCGVGKLLEEKPDDRAYT